MGAVSLTGTNVIEQGGYLVDELTGEVLGFAQKPDDKFLPTTEEGVNWVLNKMLKAEAAIAAIQHSPEVLAAKAIVENAGKLQTEHSKKLEWLHQHFDADLGEYARIQLDGKKGRTFKTIYGSISLRTIPEKVKVQDPEAAVAVAKEFYPEAVKTVESFLISKLNDDAIEEIRKGLRGTAWGHDDPARKAFMIEPAKETVTIKTGVKD
jgi:hypothetical protein